MKTANITPYWHSHASQRPPPAQRSKFLRTASIRLLVLLLLAAPAAVPVSATETWLGEGFPPVGSWLLGNEDPAKVGLIPQWYWWTWGWDSTNKTEVASWPEPPQVVVGFTDLRLVPPKEYDHPYAGLGIGKLEIIYAESQDEVRRLCPGSVFPKAGAYGCAHSEYTGYAGGCKIIVAPAADMNWAGIWMALTIRHEIAHCNGWPADHRGALPAEDWAAGPTPSPPRDLYFSR